MGGQTACGANTWEDQLRSSDSCLDGHFKLILATATYRVVILVPVLFSANEELYHHKEALASLTIFLRNSSGDMAEKHQTAVSTVSTVSTFLLRTLSNPTSAIVLQCWVYSHTRQTCLRSL